MRLIAITRKNGKPQGSVAYELEDARLNLGRVLEVDLPARQLRAWELIAKPGNRMQIEVAPPTGVVPNPLRYWEGFEQALELLASVFDLEVDLPDLPEGDEQGVVF